MGAAQPIAVVPGAGPPTPELRFAVERVEALQPAAAPTLRFTLAIDAGGAAVRSIVLGVQVQIAARRRRYEPHEQRSLADLFGTPERWGETLRTLPWTRATVVVPPFEDATAAQLDVPVTYDFEVAAARYLAGLRGGEVPLELLFSGTVFHAAADGRLLASRIAWDREAACALPVRVWREAIDQHFPGSAWIRLDRAAFDRLAEFRARRVLPSWEAALDALLDGQGG
jgi:hypothetical protein